MSGRRIVGLALIVGSVAAAFAIQVRTGALVRVDHSWDVTLRERVPGKDWYAGTTEHTDYTFGWCYAAPLLILAVAGAVCITLPRRSRSSQT